MEVNLMDLGRKFFLFLCALTLFVHLGFTYCLHDKSRTGLLRRGPSFFISVFFL